MHIKIGIIHIQSGIYPLVSYDFADAIVEGLVAEGYTVETASQDAEGGTNEKLVAEKALKLFRVDKVDAIFTLAENSQMVEALEGIAIWVKKPIVIASLGARLGIGATPSGCIYFHEFDAWKSAWFAGQEMAKRYTLTTFLASLYEAGYQFSYGYSRGISTQAGSIAPATYIIKQPNEPAEVSDMLATLDELTPDAIFMAMSYKEGAAVLAAYNQSKWAATPLFLSQFVLNEFVKPEDIANISSLYELSAIDHDKWQQQAFAQIANNEFSLLGYEAGRLIGQKQQQTTPENITIDSPRGEIHLPADRRRTHYTHYLYQISVVEGAIQRTLVQTFSDTNDADSFLDGQGQLTFSQWKNPYMFA